MREVHRMHESVTIEQLNDIHHEMNDLVELLIGVVEDGASVGFLPPLSAQDASEYWLHVLDPDVKLWVARVEGKVVGTVQLHLSNKQNGQHRAEIAKLMIDPQYRRRGIALELMRTAEAAAWLDLRTLIVLDTREGDPSNKLYQSIGYEQAGMIPFYAKSANGELHSTVFYYKVHKP